MILTPKHLRVANLAFLFIISFYLKVVESPAAHALPRFAAVIGDACTGAGQGTCDTDELCVAGICQGNNCGNGIVDSTEACDDGNQTSGDGCDSTCAQETGFTCSSPSGMVYYEYFEADASPTLNSWFGGSPGTAPVAPTEVNFIDNMQEADISPVEDVTEDFVFDLEGTINVPATGNWTFFTSSDDGSRLYIDGNEVVNNDGLHGVVE